MNHSSLLSPGCCAREQAALEYAVVYQLLTVTDGYVRVFGGRKLNPEVPAVRAVN